MKKVISSEQIPIKLIKYNKLKRKCDKCKNPIDDRCKGDLCHKCIDRSGINNNFYGKKHTLETRERMKEKAKLKDKSVYYKIPITKEITDKRRATKKRNWDKLSIEEKHKKLKNWIKAGKKRKGTKIEKIIRKVLDNIGMIKNVDYETNVYISGLNVDVLVNKRFIIECYGDYWHKNPKYYNKIEDIKKRKSDSKRRKFLENKGYEFISFWETEIHTELKKVKKKLEVFFRSYINLFEWESCSH